jgi:hypothetical protein
VTPLHRAVTRTDKNQDRTDRVVTIALTGVAPAPTSVRRIAPYSTFATFAPSALRRSTSWL